MVLINILFLFDFETETLCFHFLYLKLYNMAMSIIYNRDTRLMRLLKVVVYNPPIVRVKYRQTYMEVIINTGMFKII